MEKFVPPASYEEARKMMGRIVEMPNGEPAQVGGAGSSGPDFSVNFVPVEYVRHRWIAFWSSNRGFELEADRRLRMWDAGAEKLPANARKLVVKVLGNVFEQEGRDKLKEPARLPAIAIIRLVKAGLLEYEDCSRCGGSGHYSYNQMSGTRCFKCNGNRKQLPPVGKALKVAVRCEAA